MPIITDEVLTEIQGQFTDVLVISELRGAYPNVPISADIDYADLTKGDLEPTFITLPIGKANVKSANNRYYDAAWLTELMRQTIATRPVGLMGHLSGAERATAFPKESLHWVGAVLDSDGIAWGKAYILGEARDRVRRYKASGKSIATSIDATASGTWDESLKAYRMDATTLKLNQIDLAPADRAGIGDLARVPMLTSEMTQDVLDKEEPIMAEKDKLTIIQELTSDDARLLPDSVRAAILATVTPPAEAPEVKQITELRAVLGLDATVDLVKRVGEFVLEQNAARKAAVTSRITELVTSGVKLEAGRAIVQEMVTDHNPQTVEEAEAVFEQVMKRPSVTRLLAAQVREIMGPRQGTPVAGQATKDTPKFYSIPAAEPN